MKRSLSGIKPTGTPHLGNYFGMIKPAIELQEEYESFYFVAEYHAMTQEKNAKRLRASTYDITAQFLAFGLDPEKAHFYRQSLNPEVCELAWMLSCVTGVGYLKRAHSYKAAKALEAHNELNVGTFIYPVLMAADILMFDADVVPVGKDQIQHLEMTALIARRFNNRYGEVFKVPAALVSKEATVPGTDGQKMSKSYDNIINPLAEPAEVMRRCMQIVTDSTPMDKPMDPDTCNVFALWKLISAKDSVAEMREDYSNPKFGYGHAKRRLGEHMISFFAPYRDEYVRISADISYLDDVLDNGDGVVSDMAILKMRQVREAVGVGR